MNNGKRLSKDKQRYEMIAQAISGMPQREIAAHHGVTQQAVSKILSDNEIRAIIDQERRIMVGYAPEAREKLIEKMRSAVDEKIQVDCAKEVLKSTGILPSHTPPALVQQVFNQVNIFSGGDHDSLKDFMAWRSSQDVVDIEQVPQEGDESE